MILTKDAIRIAEDMLDTCDFEERLAARVETDRDFRKHLKENNFRTNLVTLPNNAQVIANWRHEGRQCLAMSPDLMDVITNATTVSVVTETLATLPYINPMVTFPVPLYIPAWEQASGGTESLRVLGFILHGVTAGRTAIVSTHDPETEYFAALVICQVLNEAGQVIDHQLDRISLPLNDPGADIHDVARAALEQYVWDHEAEKSLPRAKGYVREQFIAKLYQIIIASVMYLCSTTLEAETVPRRQLRGMKPGAARHKSIDLIKVGWNMGAALTKARREWEANNAPDIGGRSQGPQHRRCHFKTVWSGPGRTIPKTCFVAPYWTKRELLGEKGTNTVRVVPR